ncbi:hypothetical protein CDAR_21661 [Caerostris darwini]|uniref:Uncharacterized protein n=1 Tax=Caerostris darwini TaxID=1538125 RepID=A0AAV4VGG5_9ARAC|nr:hypothetical protein CDAR_21661 [Caerostris darwini]
MRSVHYVKWWIVGCGVFGKPLVIQPVEGLRSTSWMALSYVANISAPVVWCSGFKPVADEIPSGPIAPSGRGSHGEVKLVFPLKRITYVSRNHDSLAQKVESNHSDSHYLWVGSPHSRPLALIWAPLEVGCLDNLKGNHSPLNRIICVQSHHDSLAQKVESNHSDTHQLRVGSPHTRPLTLIWATSGVCYLVFILTVLKQILKVVD